MSNDTEAQRKLLPLPTGTEKRLIAVERSLEKAQAAIDVATVAHADLQEYLRRNKK